MALGGGVALLLVGDHQGKVGIHGPQQSVFLALHLLEQTLLLAKLSPLLATTPSPQSFSPYSLPLLRYITGVKSLASLVIFQIGSSPSGKGV